MGMTGVDGTWPEGWTTTNTIPCMFRCKGAGFRVSKVDTPLQTYLGNKDGTTPFTLARTPPPKSAPCHERPEPSQR